MPSPLYLPSRATIRAPAFSQSCPNTGHLPPAAIVVGIGTTDQGTGGPSRPERARPGRPRADTPKPPDPPNYGIFPPAGHTGASKTPTTRGDLVNRKELVAAVADAADLEQKTVDAVLRALQSTLEGAAAKGEKVSVPGFFALSVGDRAAREGRNPATGETIKIAAAKTVKLAAGSALKDAANGK